MQRWTPPLWKTFCSFSVESDACLQNNPAITRCEAPTLIKEPSEAGLGRVTQEEVEGASAPIPSGHLTTAGPSGRPACRSRHSSESLTFRVIAGFKDVQLVGIVCECKHLNHRVQNNHNSRKKEKINQDSSPRAKLNYFGILFLSF